MFAYINTSFRKMACLHHAMEAWKERQKLVSFLDGESAVVSWPMVSWPHGELAYGELASW
jgi:hypothetical protein